MTKKKRKILFLIFLFLFLLVAPLAILYSQGYRFDFENRKLTQTGGLFLMAVPKGVEIYIDNKLVKKTSFFFGSALIENLLPKKHKIEVKKEGYLSWQKNLEIKEKEVTEVKNLVLFPKNLNFTPLQKNNEKVENFWFSPDGKKMILKESTEGGWALKLYDLKRNIKSHLINEKDVYPAGADLLNLKFAENSKEISLEMRIKEKVKYFTLEIERVPPVLREINSPSPPRENIITYQTFNGQLYYLDNFGQLFKNEERLTEKPFPVKPETEYALEIFPDALFLREGQILYQFNFESKSFEKFFEPIKNLKISPDLKKIVYFSDHEIWILFLKDSDSTLNHQKGDKVFLVRLSEKIGNLFWLNSDYLIFNSQNKIKIAEIDDRDRINIMDIAEFPTSQLEIFFSQAIKKLYILTEGNLYQSEALF